MKLVVDCQGQTALKKLDKCTSHIVLAVPFAVKDWQTTCAPISRRLRSHRIGQDLRHWRAVQHADIAMQDHHGLTGALLEF